VLAGVHLSVLVVPYGKDQRLFVARDVTRLHKVHQSQSDFIANLSHELRTPLTVVRGFVEALRGQSDACPPGWVEPLAQMEGQVERMQSIVEDMLLLSKLDQDDKPLHAEEVDVPHLLHRIHREALALSAAQGHRIILEVDDSLLLLGERAQIYSAFSNLVVNAVQNTEPNGSITLRWYQDPIGAHFVVTDTGVGIADFHLPRLTERFYRADSSRSPKSGGTGLGLAIVSQILKLHNATLHITSESGKGSTFRCDFPFVAIVLEGREGDSDRGDAADPYSNGDVTGSTAHEMDTAAEATAGTVDATGVAATAHTAP
jgi:two-component system phosphate regulon sensor histidine kinase PhoR